MGIRLAPRGKYLDPRSFEQAAERPYRLAANIPSSELASRLHELPSRGETVQVCAGERSAHEAVAFLRSGGRLAEMAEPVPADSPQTYRLWEPNEFLRSVGGELKRGRAVDLGCGSGRDAVFLACEGFEVEAVDRLEDALELGMDLERRYTTPEVGPGEVRWVCRDLEREGPPPGTFDLIVSFRYLQRELIGGASELLNPSGSLVVETFTTLHRERHGKPSSDAHVLQLQELPALAKSLEIVQYVEAWRGESHTARLWARKPD